MRVHPRRAWWCSFVLVGGLFALWSLASPLISVPDEGAHIVAAAGVVRGHLNGPEVRGPSSVFTLLEVPEFYARTTDGRYTCFARLPDVTAGCAPRIRGSGLATRVATNFARYPPVPYVVLGVPSLLPGSVTAVRLMRLSGALACAALVASGLASAASLRRGMTVAATLLALTPMAAFLAGSVNTSGLEIAAAIALWPSLLALLEHGRAAPTSLVVRTAIAACALAVTRPLSPLWMVLIVGVAAVAAGRQKVRPVLRDPRVVRAAAVVAAVTAVSVVWVVVSDSLARIGGTGHGQGFLRDFVTSTGMFDTRLKEMIGVEGWLDTPTPALLLYAWVAATGGLLLLAAATGRRRGLVALLGTAALVYLVPVTIEAARARSSGFPWQGRYTLPLAVGVPILAGWLVDTSAATLGAVGRRAGRVLIVVAAAGHLVAHAWSMRRYVAGFHGTIVYVLADGWRPPLPAWLLLVAFAIVLTGLALWVDRLAGWDEAPASEP